MMGDETSVVAAPDEDAPYYAYKPSLMGAAWEFWLRPAGLGWRTGGYEGEIPYRDIQSVRLSYRPMTMQTRRFVTILPAARAPRLVIASSSWRSMVEHANQLEGYSAFVRALHERLACAGSTATFRAGLPAPIYWAGLAAFLVIAVTTVALAVRALMLGEWVAAALIGAFVGVFAWHSGGFFDRNRPRDYRPDAVPVKLVPSK
jgi:hypothetical protein